MKKRYCISVAVLCLFLILAGCGGGGDFYQDIIAGTDQVVANRYCGDGVEGAEELCDDGNTSSGDGCSSACIIEFRDFGWSRWTGRRQAAGDDDWDDWDEKDEDEEDAFGNISENTFITIDDVSYSTPASGQFCIVTASLTLLDEDEEATIYSVRLVYSVNGGTEQLIEMTDAGSGNWIGSIPPNSAGANVRFYIWAGDSNGNVTTGGISSDYNLVPGVPDIDNSSEIVGDDADITNIAVSYDDDYVYAAYKVQGDITGGTVDPPYIMLYGIKITNPDTEQGEGLMEKKLWINLPLATDPRVQESFLPMISPVSEADIPQEEIDRFYETGMLVEDIQKIMAGNMAEALLFEAEPEGKDGNGIFYGKIKRAPLGDNPSGYMRLIVLTAANASLDSYMPAPLNCSNFLTIYFSDYGYTVN